ncbi:MAG: PDZ domain-containing protein [Myxococcota bacterium]
MRRLGILLALIGVAVVAAMVALRPSSTAPEPSPTAARPDATVRRVLEIRDERAPSEAPPTPVECELAEIVAPLSGLTIEEVDPDTLEPLRTHRLRHDRTWVTFTPVHAIGLGIARGPGLLPATVGWADGACLDLVDLRDPPKVPLVVEVHNGERYPDVTLRVGVGEGARILHNVPPGSSEVTIQVPEHHDLDIQATARFGGQVFEAPRVEAPADAGRTAVELPDHDPPMGWQLRMGKHGAVRIHDLMLDSPLRAAGLRPGDRVLEIDGQPVADGLDAVPDSFREGVVERDGAEIDFTLD